MPTIESKILDIKGKPIKKEILQKEHATASVTGVRNPWMTDSMANGLNPSKLASIIKKANEGDDYDLLTLAEEMEERDSHYFSVLSTRKLAVEGLPITVEAASDDAKDIEIAEAVTKLTKKPEFEELISDLLDGLGKGRSTCEIMWQTGESFNPIEYTWRDPRFFKLHPENPRELRLVDEADNINGVELPAHKYITHIPKLKTGIVSRSGLARINFVNYMCKSFSISDWMAYAELLGIPIRLGRYGANTSEEDMDVLRIAVASLGSDAAAIIPDSMKVEFIERSNSNGENIFRVLSEWLDKQTSKAVLGQTATTEGQAGSLGSNEEQSEVRQDILKADAKQIARTINRQLVKAFVDWNFGVQEHYPTISLYVEEPEDTKSIVESVEKLVPLGLRVRVSEFNEKLNLSTPDDDDEILKVPVAAPANEETNTATNHAQSCPTCNTATSLNQDTSNLPLSQRGNEGDLIDDLVDESLEEWEEIMEPIVNPIQELANSSQNQEEFEAGLPAVIEMMSTTQLVMSLSKQTLKARGLGDTQ